MHADARTIVRAANRAAKEVTMTFSEDMTMGTPRRDEGMRGRVQSWPSADGPFRLGRAAEAGRAGREAWQGAEDGRTLATMLGWFSIGLGALEVLAPRSVLSCVGVRPSNAGARVVQAMGLREIANGAGIVQNPVSKEWVGSRIVGDVLDFALLGVAFAKSERRERTLLATVAVAGVALLDLLATERLAESRRTPARARADDAGSPVVRSITIGRPRTEVYTMWRQFTNFRRFMENIHSIEDLGNGRSKWVAAGPAGMRVEWESEIVADRPDEMIQWRSVEGSLVYHAGTVRFKDAPRGEGTVVTVEMRYAPPGGTIAAAMLKLLRKEPGQQIGDDLRRLKQVMETGEVLLSDASSVAGPHAAQPPRRESVH
jgi:uncharacterized membrane protein